jgi:hypothetical protein
MTLLDLDISDRILASAEPWLPGLSTELSFVKWQEAADLSMSPSTYGTNRWLNKRANGDRLDLGTIHFPDGSTWCLEALPPEARLRYEALGLTFASDFSISDATTAIHSALEIINAHPSLYNSVRDLIRCVHILQSTGEEYDISHSDPQVPFSIFVSIPPPGCLQAFRLAESIVHEAMHLQLTQLENSIELVTSPFTTGYSPWQQTERPTGGLLHGLYVFSVIGSLHLKLSEKPNLNTSETVWLRNRREQIIHETDSVFLILPFEALTLFAIKLVKLISFSGSQESRNTSH